MYSGIPVRISDSGHAHLTREGFDPFTLCDMILGNLPCPKKKKNRKFRKTSIELCANRKGKVYRIILDKQYTTCKNSYSYVVCHVEPV